MTGQFIPFEGSHCAGKGTQIKGLEALAKEYNLPFSACIDTRLDFEEKPLESLGNFFERKYLRKLEEIKQTLVDNQVEDRVKDGETVVIDRYIHSLYAIYSFYGIRKQRIRRDMKKFPQPSRILTLTIPPDETVKRAIIRNKNTRPHKLNVEYNTHLNLCFNYCANENTIVLDGLDTKANLHRIIRTTLWPKITFDSDYIPDPKYRHKHQTRPL